MPYKFEQLEVWQLSMEYTDLIYPLAEQLPRSEEYNLKSQIIRAATSIERSQTLARKLQAFRKSPGFHQIREDTADYLVDTR